MIVVAALKFIFNNLFAKISLSIKFKQIKFQPELIPYMVFIDRPFARIYTKEPVKMTQGSDVQKEMLADKLMHYNTEKLVDGFCLRRRAIAEGNIAPAEGK